ncbi:MAG: diguanylate cyclase [Actinomycetota bacterium]|nr:diguanylate cyclase [Actinomycetota bacterium]
MEIKPDHYRLTILSAAAALVIMIEYILHFTYKLELFSANLLFIPIVIAAYWWGFSGGFATGLIFAALHIILELLLAREPNFTWIMVMILRSSVFVIVGCLSGLFEKERIMTILKLTQKEEELDRSREVLQDWSKLLEQRLNEKTEEIFTLYKISKETSTAMDLKLLLKRVLEIIMPIIDADVGAILLIDSENLVKCWEERGCTNRNCPVFKSTNLKCWAASSRSVAKEAGYKTKLKRCVKCDIFKNLELKPVATFGLDKRVAAGFKTKLGDSLLGEAILEGKPVIEQVKDIEGDNGLLDIYIDDIKSIDLDVLKNLHRVLEGDLDHATSDAILVADESGIHLPRTHVILPLFSEGEILGVLYFANTQSREYREDIIEMLTTVADRIAVAIDNAQLHKEAKTLTMTDDLTGLFNFRYFQDQLKKELARSNRYKRPVSLIILDIDRFKHYNDTYGHWAGNLAIKGLSVLLIEGIREKIDIAARYGGEEFCLILPETGKEAAMEISERIRAAVEANDFDKEGLKIGSKLTVSIGVATYPFDADDVDYFIKAADKALYKAKQTGRNRVVSARKKRVKVEPDKERG